MINEAIRVGIEKDITSKLTLRNELYLQFKNEFLVKGKLCTEIKKHGGRYTKNQRHKRRVKVYHLHFELEYSAVKISEMMKINRHTISADIQYWNEQLADEWEKIKSKKYKHEAEKYVDLDEVLDQINIPSKMPRQTYYQVIQSKK